MAGILEADDDDDEIASGKSRPRVVKVRESKVKSSVLVNVGLVERTAFEILNQKRLERGLQPLVWNTDLFNVARGHSQNMSEFQFFAHRGLDGKMVSDRADDSGLGNWRAIGENIAFNRGYQDPIAKAVEGWLDSPTHMRNLLDDKWKESAIGVAVAADGSYYFTQVFLVRK
ncbi:MAG: CAP domain-containing protein [Pyrinomonadaceae bacterium]